MRSLLLIQSASACLSVCCNRTWKIASLLSVAILVLMTNICHAQGDYQISPRATKSQRTTKLVNKTGYKVRIHVFHRGDLVRGVASKNTHIANNGSLTLSAKGESFRVNVFKAQIIDKLVARDLWVTGTTTLRSNGRGRVIAVSSSPTRIANLTGETIKVCIYNEKDRIQAVPKKVWAKIRPGQTVTYSKPIAEKFRLSVFSPALGDRRLATKIVSDRRQIDIKKWGPLSTGSEIWAFGDSLTKGVVDYQVSPRATKSQRTKLVNKTGYKVRIHAFYRGDLVRGVASKNTHIANNGSLTLSTKGESFRVNVFKAQIIDKLVARDLWVTGTTTLRSTRQGRVIAANNSPTRIANLTGETIKVCIYNEKDRVQAVPKKVWAKIRPGQTVTYSKPIAEKFRLSVFFPALVDQRLATKIVSDRRQIDIKESTKGYPEELNSLLGDKYSVRNFGKSGEPLSFAANDYLIKKGAARSKNDYGLYRFKAALKKAVKNPPALILLCQGANDRVVAMHPGILTQARKKIEDGIKTDLKKMIAAAREAGSRIVLVSQAQEEAVTIDGDNYSVTFAGSAPAYYAEIGRELGAPVDNDSLPNIYKSLNAGYLSRDGRHLSAKGDKKLAADLAKFLLNQKILE